MQPKYAVKTSAKTFTQEYVSMISREGTTAVVPRLNMRLMMREGWRPLVLS